MDPINCTLMAEGTQIPYVNQFQAIKIFNLVHCWQDGEIKPCDVIPASIERHGREVVNRRPFILVMKYNIPLKEIVSNGCTLRQSCTARKLTYLTSKLLKKLHNTISCRGSLFPCTKSYNLNQ